MKVVINETNRKSQNCDHHAPIPLVRMHKKPVNKSDRIVYKLRSTPVVDESPTYEMPVYMFEVGTPEELLNFVSDMRKVFVRQNVTTGPPKYMLM